MRCIGYAALIFSFFFIKKKEIGPSGHELLKKSFAPTFPRSMPRWHLPLKRPKEAKPYRWA
jgi:hypothetical protein